MNLKRLAVIAATVSLAVAGGTFAGVALATPTPSGQQYTGCVERGQLFDVTIGTLPHGCPRFSTEITWNQTGPQGPAGSSNTKLYTWTVTVPASSSTAYSQLNGNADIPAGSTVSGVSATATGDLSTCPSGAITAFYVSAPSTDAQGGDSDIAGWAGLTHVYNDTGSTFIGTKFVSASGPMSAEVYCDGETYESGPGTFTPAVTITIIFAVTVPPPGPAQTYS